MKNLVLLSTLTLFVYFQVLGQENEKISKEEVFEIYKPYNFNGMPYRLMSPINFNANNKYPVIVSLHGASREKSEDIRVLRNWNFILAEKDNRISYPAYVLAPGSRGMWNETHLKNIKEIISELPSVDMNRIYILGHSMGGEGTYRLIHMDTDYFAAAVPCAGSGKANTEDYINAEKIKDIPIWTFHGDNDSVCPYSRAEKVFEEMKKVGANFKFTTWAGDGHRIADKMIYDGDNGTTQYSSNRCDKEPEFLKWLLKQNLQN